MYGDGRVVYRTANIETAEMRIALLDPAEVEDLIAFSIDEGGLRDTQSESAFGAIDGVQFDVYAAALIGRVDVLIPLSRLLTTTDTARQGVRRLAQRLTNFDSEVGSRSIPWPACAITPTETIERNDVVAWDKSIWQNSGADVWAAPFGGFSSYAPEFKVLWWVPHGNGHPLTVDISRIDDGAGAPLDLQMVLEADRVRPQRADRPSGVPSLPPGCYTFEVSIGDKTGSLVEQVSL
jgi:hypothetical protein